MTVKKYLSVLGCTGSIGLSALKIAEMHPDRFQVKILAAANNVSLLASQIRMFKPDIAVVLTYERAKELKSLLSKEEQPKILFGDDGYIEAAASPIADTVLLAMVGAAGLMPALAAVDAKKQIALANKETLVMAGELVMARAKKLGVKIFPVDSEHSAIFQCMEGNREKDVRKIFLTASGGPFRTKPAAEFAAIQPEDALNHPTWAMGCKITIDSSTLMNKALEIIEAVRLFYLPPSWVEVLIHHQSIVHSMVGFNDGAVIAQMGVPDMKGAIAYALSWPERLDLGLDFPDFFSLGSLYFEKPDPSRFPSLDFAFEALKQGGTLPAVMNAANEAAVEAFINHRTDFPGIFRIIETCMARHLRIDCPDLSDILDADRWARDTARSLLKSCH